MIVLLAIWLWLLIGATIGRIVFVRILGDNPRRAAVTRRDRYDRRYDGIGWTEVFTRAVSASIACVVAWPVALPLALMLAHTGTEKLQAKRARLEDEVARLEREIARG